MVADENLVEKFPKVARYQQKIILIGLKVFLRKIFLKEIMVISSSCNKNSKNLWSKDSN